MECSYERENEDEMVNTGHRVTRHPSYQPSNRLLPIWFDLRVFYVRVCNCEVDNSTPEYLTVNHIPLSPESLLEVNGVRSSIYSEGVSSVLRRDRMDKISEEATFVSTDSIRMTGSVKFEVYDKDDLVLSGVLEMSNGNGCGRQWSMNCKSEMIENSSFLKGKQYFGPELASPTIEVYVTGCFSGTPIILSKTLQLNSRRKQMRKGILDAIPEYETTEEKKEVSSELALQEEQEYRGYIPEHEEDYNLYSRTEYIDGEDGELSWFNAGVRVGVGIGLGVCLGIGIGVGLLVRTYQTTTRNFTRRHM